MAHPNQLAFPGMFPYGECQLDMTREVPLHEGRYINSLIMRRNGRHHKPYFVFHAENQNEHRQLQSSINFQSRKSFGGKLKTQKDLEEATKGNKAWTVFKQNRTTPGYWENAKKDVLAMIQQLGPFSLWFTFSANDLNWVTPVKQVAASEGVNLTDEQVNEMPYLERIKWINRNPALVTLYIYDVLRTLFFDFIIKAEPMGAVIMW